MCTSPAQGSTSYLCKETTVGHSSSQSIPSGGAVMGVGPSSLCLSPMSGAECAFLNYLHLFLRSGLCRQAVRELMLVLLPQPTPVPGLQAYTTTPGECVFGNQSSFSSDSAPKHSPVVTLVQPPNFYILILRSAKSECRIT